MAERSEYSPVWIILVTLILAGIGWGIHLRWVPVETAFLYGDELHSLPLLGLGFGRLMGLYEPYGSGILLPLAQKSFVQLFGPTLTALRAIAWIPGMLLIPATYRLARRECGTAAAPVAGLLVATGSIFIFYSHFARAYSFSALSCICFCIALDHLRRVNTDVPVEGAAEVASAHVDRVRLGWLMLAALAGGLAVYAHLTSGLFIAAYGLGLLACGLATRDRFPWRSLGAAFVGAGVVALGLHAPAFESLAEFMQTKGDQSYHGAFGAIDVVRVLAGSNLGAWLLVITTCAGAVIDIRERGARSFPLLAAVLLPFVLLLVVSPYGDAYAYARYLLPSAAAATLLSALAIARFARRLFGAAPSDLPEWSLGVGVAALFVAAGPHGLAAPDNGAFANSYLGLYRLPAFSQPSDAAPNYYETLGASDGSLVILEAPMLPNRSIHYYRHLQQAHGHDVKVGLFGSPSPGLPELNSSIYVDLSRPDELVGSFDRLILHRRLIDEVDHYWASVYAQDHGGSEQAFMERHRIYGRDIAAVGDRVFEQLTEILGPPIHADDEIVVWEGRVDPSRSDHE